VALLVPGFHVLRFVEAIVEAIGERSVSVVPSR
jgi:hypothetical protein